MNQDNISTCTTHGFAEILSGSIDVGPRKVFEKVFRDVNFRLIIRKDGVHHRQVEMLLQP